MKKKYSVGMHDFINSSPFLYPIRHGLVDLPFDVVTDTPSNLADRFKRGEVDLALLPAIEYARIDGCKIVEPYCIASLGEVESVLLFSEVSLAEIDSVFIDPKSRTSVAMLQILFKRQFGRDIELVIASDVDPLKGLDIADGSLVIGDSAFDLDRDRYVVYDLGKLWYQFSSRPFAHAVFVTRLGSEIGFVVESLNHAISTGLDHIDIVIKSMKNEKLSEDFLYRYLHQRIKYRLDKSVLEGLSYFLSEAFSLGLADKKEVLIYEN